MRENASSPQGKEINNDAKDRLSIKKKKKRKRNRRKHMPVRLCAHSSSSAAHTQMFFPHTPYIYAVTPPPPIASPAIGCSVFMS